MALSTRSLNKYVRKQTNGVRLNQVVSFLNKNISDASFEQNDLSFVLIKDKSFSSTEELRKYVDQLKLNIDKQFSLSKFNIYISHNSSFTRCFFRMQMPSDGHILE